MNLPPGFPGGGWDTKYLKHTYMMYIDAWIVPSPCPTHPALSCRNHYYGSVHHNSSIPKHKTCFWKRKKIPGNFLESSRHSRNYSKMVVLDSLTNSTLFRGQVCHNLTYRTDFQTKLTENKYLSTWKLWLPLTGLIFNRFWCSFF